MRKRNRYWPTTLKLGTGNATWICATLAALSRGVGIQPHAPECEFVLSVASGESGRYVLQVALQCSRAVHFAYQLIAQSLAPCFLRLRSLCNAAKADAGFSAAPAAGAVKKHNWAVQSVLRDSCSASDCAKLPCLSDRLLLLGLLYSHRCFLALTSTLLWNRLAQLPLEARHLRRKFVRARRLFQRNLHRQSTAGPERDEERPLPTPLSAQRYPLEMAWTERKRHRQTKQHSASCQCAGTDGRAC